MTKITLRLAVVAALVASAPAASALSISDLFGSSTASAERGFGFLSFKKFTRRLDAEDNDTSPMLSFRAPAASQSVSTGGTLGSVLPVVSSEAGQSVEGITATPPTAVTEFVTSLAVPVTSVAAVVSDQKVADPSADARIATTPLPAGGLLLGVAALALAGLRRFRHG